MVLLFAAPQLDIFSNTIGLKWRTVKRLHGLTGITVSALVILHIVASQLDKEQLSLSESEDVWSIIVSEPEADATSNFS
jgi:hypothetical protein